MHRTVVLICVICEHETIAECVVGVGGIALGAAQACLLQTRWTDILCAHLLTVQAAGLLRGELDTCTMEYVPCYVAWRRLAAVAVVVVN